MSNLNKPHPQNGFTDFPFDNGSVLASVLGNVKDRSTTPNEDFNDKCSRLFSGFPLGFFAYLKRCPHCCDHKYIIRHPEAKMLLWLKLNSEFTHTLNVDAKLQLYEQRIS